MKNSISLSHSLFQVSCEEITVKNIKALLISITSIILVAFLALSFSLYDVSDTVKFVGNTNSYAEKYAKENKLDFEAIPDSDKSAKDKNENKEQDRNEEFDYNFSGETVTIIKYNGTSSYVTIPETIENKSVTKVVINAVEQGIDTIEIPDSVNSIEGTYKTARYDSYLFVAAGIMIIGYIFSLISTIIAFKKEQDITATFFGVPASYSGFVTYILLIILSILELVLKLNIAISCVIAVIIIVVSAIKLVKICFAVDTVQNVDEKIKIQTFFIKSLTVDAQTLIQKAKTDEIKQIAKKVYEAIRYSDPMSNEALANSESSITLKFKEFEEAVINDDTDLASESSKELLVLINDRNQKCKLLK